jgi:lipid II:glycine glycyltransferase (peptidoglycan interpeptide bridge formation enzyme)
MHDWDAFVAHSEGGHYGQSSLWARLLARDGWVATRFAISDHDGPAAGIQLLVKSLGGLVRVGYVPRGPLVPAEDRGISAAIVDALVDHAADQHVRYLAVSPARPDSALEGALLAKGFETATRHSIGATLRLDLRQRPEELLAGMNKWTRRNIRRGESHGVTVRLGTESDLPTFFALKEAGMARKRNRYSRFPDDYFRDLWQIFRPGGHVELFLADSRRETVSALLAIAFGEAVYAYATAWSGRHGADKPNEVLEWEAITWARAQGYRYFDFEGVSRELADAAHAQGGVVDPAELGRLAGKITRFKLGFGGDLVLYPRTYSFVPNPFLRGMVRRFHPLFGRRSIRRVRRRMAGRSAG